MAERNTRVFVSDAHISHQTEIGPGCHDYAWLRRKDAEALTRFLEHLDRRQDVEEVVFLGDLFDSWVFPVDIEPPSFEEIISRRKAEGDPLLKALAALCANASLRVVCLPGNHDMELTAEVVAAHFPGMVFGGTAIWNAGSSVYRTSRLRAEHGSAHTLFNAPDPVNNPGARLPLGYFISRVVATRAHATGHGDRHWWTYADDLLEALGPETFAHSVFEAVLEEARLPLATEIRLPKRNGQPVAITAREVSERYRNLYDQWKERVGAGLAFKAVLAEIGYLDDAADRLCKQNDTRIVIFGHCHDWALDKDAWFVADRIYANCGTWCDPSKPRTYVEVATRKGGSKERVVRVKEWKSDRPGKTLGEESVPL